MKGIAYTVPLRADFMAQLVLPCDLSKAEARRMSALLETLVIPIAAQEVTP